VVEHSPENPDHGRRAFLNNKVTTPMTNARPCRQRQTWRAILRVAQSTELLGLKCPSDVLSSSWAPDHMGSVALEETPNPILRPPEGNPRGAQAASEMN
jgi:hypothetical protein